MSRSESSGRGIMRGNRRDDGQGNRRDNVVHGRLVADRRRWAHPLPTVMLLGGLLVTPAVAQVNDVVLLAPVEATALDVDAAAEPPAFLKTMVNGELSFIHRVCQPTDDQMKQIVEQAKLAFLAMSDLRGNDQPQIPQAVAFRNSITIIGPDNTRLSENPYTRVRQDAAKYLQPLVSPQQYDQYLEEARERDEFERRAAIEIAVHLIDQRVVLAEKQRRQLRETFFDKWLELDVLWIEMYEQNPQLSPPIPVQWLQPTLTPAQQSIWATYSNSTMYLHLSEDVLCKLEEEWIP